MWTRFLFSSNYCLVVKELFQQLVEWHFKHLKWYFSDIHNSDFALVAEAKDRDWVIIVPLIIRWWCKTFVNIFFVFDLHAAIVMIIVVGMNQFNLFAVFNFTKTKSSRSHLFDHLVQRNIVHLFVFIVIHCLRVKLNNLLLGFLTHLFDFLADASFGLLAH